MSIISKITRIFNKKEKVPGTEQAPKKEIDFREYTGKFVMQGDKPIGESVAVNEDRIIIKYAEGFMSIPVDSVKENADNIIVGEFDREESLQLGKEWFERKDTLKFDEKGMMIQEEVKE